MMMPMTSGGMMQQMGGNGLGGGMQLRQIKVVGIPNVFREPFLLLYVTKLATKIYDHIGRTG
jgi:hypothetical protein